MANTTNTTSEDVRTSVASIYSELLEKRRMEREAREEKKRQEREAKLQEKEEKYSDEDGTKKSKKERRAAELDNWKEVIVGLTGDDLEYSDQKKSRKKYKKWIDDEAGENVVLTAKPKKVKKRNYQKEFEPELNMLKSIVTDQNKFTADLQKRFNNAAGPATKDAQLPNKTLVELASVINAGRSNSLGILREVGNLKKTIADLYMKQKKLDADMGGGGFNTSDIGLMGSNIASSLFADSTPIQTPTTFGSNDNPVQQSSPVLYQQEPTNNTTAENQATSVGQPTIQVTAFDPSTWDGGPSLTEGSMVPFERVPHNVVVEWNKNSDTKRFKAVRSDTGEEITDYPIPTSDVSKLKVNEKDMKVKGEFDEIYTLEIV